MLPFLSEALKAARVAAGRKQVHVAAALDRNQSTIHRFESGLGYPQDLDAVIAAYADDLGVDVLVLWEAAIALWRADRGEDEEGEGLAAVRAVREQLERAHPPAESARGGQARPASTPRKRAS